jgi:hypothetical protein
LGSRGFSGGPHRWAKSLGGVSIYAKIDSVSRDGTLETMAESRSGTNGWLAVAATAVTAVVMGPERR